MELKMLKPLVTIFLCALVTNLSVATDYIVGGPNGNGWSQSTDFQTWASSITFLQGDNLVFRFTINHDVAEVSKADYDSCTLTNPLQTPLSGGSAVIPLDTPGTRYFICQTSGHCITGMKLEINTLPNTTPPPEAVPESPPPTTPSVPSTTAPPLAAPTSPGVLPMPPAATPPTIQPHPPTKSISPSLSPKHSRHIPSAPKLSPSSTPSTSIPPLSGSSISPAPLSSNARANVMSGLLAFTASMLIMIKIFH